MNLTPARTTKLAIAGVMLLVAVIILWTTSRKNPLPGADAAAVVQYSDGTTFSTTWQEVYARAQQGKAYLDRSPGGTWMYQSESGQWGAVTNPGSASKPAPTGG